MESSFVGYITSRERSRAKCFWESLPDAGKLAPEFTMATDNSKFPINK